MDYQEIVHLLNTDPYVKKLLDAPIQMRIAYTGLDGHPRAVPVSYLWDGRAFVFASATGAYKVRAIAAHPEVAFTVDTNDFWPLTMLVRGTAEVEIRPGIPREHVEASRRHIPADKFEEWERTKREILSEMAVITITPTHVTVLDFETRFPPGQSTVTSPASEDAAG